MDLDRVRRQFPVTASVIHLNHAGVSPTPSCCAEAMKALADDAAQHGTLHARKWQQEVDALRGDLARLIGAQAPDIAFTKNTTHGLILAANSIPWQEGENVVTTDLEFPANIYPWLSLEWRGVETRIVPRRDGRIVLDDLAAAMDARTRALAISWVEFSNGFTNDLAALSQLCRDRGLFFVVDGIQGVGALTIDLSALAVDFFAGAAHKWLLGPEGFGYLYCRPEALERILPGFVGWHGVVNPDDYLDYDLTLQPDARRFEEGGPSVIGAHGLAASVRLLLGVGPAAIEARVLALTDWLTERLGGLDYTILSSREPGEKSGIVSCLPPRGSPRRVVSALRSRNMVAAVRDGAIRLSPHFYNSEEELEGVLEVMAGCGES
ncbi:MAG: aminotransferase class V-fold PLP-dependent enzyme [Armatimonadota bacterium]